MPRSRPDNIHSGTDAAGSGWQRTSSVDSMQVKKLVTRRELREVWGIPYCQQHISRLEAAGRFPKRIRLGQNRVAWLMEEVLAWIEERVAARDAKKDA